VLYFSLLKSQGSGYVYNKIVTNNNYYNKFSNFIINREMPDELPRTVNVTLNPPSDRTISTTHTNSHCSSHKEEFRFHYKQPPLIDGFWIKRRWLSALMRKINTLRRQNYAKPKKTINRDGVVGITTCYGLDSPGFEIWRRIWTFLQNLHTSSRAYFNRHRYAFPGTTRHQRKLTTHFRIALRPIMSGTILPFP